MLQKHLTIRVLGVAIALFAAQTVFAQERHVVDRSDMKAAVVAKASTAASDRAAVLDAVHQPEATQIAQRLGLDLARVDDAVATLSPSELKDLAGPARAAAEARTQPGGDYVVISITTLLLILILVVLLLKY